MHIYFIPNNEYNFSIKKSIDAAGATYVLVDTFNYSVRRRKKRRYDGTMIKLNVMR